MNTPLKKAVVVGYKDRIPMAILTRLEESGFAVEVRDAEKAREVTRALPVGTEVVVSFGSNAYGEALTGAAKRVGAKVFSGSGSARILNALDTAGIIKASDAEAAYIAIGVLGDLTKRQQEEIAATVRRWSRGVARVAHWLERGAGQLAPEAGLNGYIIVADFTPKEVRQSFRRYLEDTARGAVTGAHRPEFETPCVTARYDEIVRTDGEANAVLGKWFVQLERACQKVGEQMAEEKAAHAPAGPPAWATKQAERERSQRERWERERIERAEEAERERERQADAAAKEAEVRALEQVHAEALVENATLDANRLKLHGVHEGRAAISLLEEAREKAPPALDRAPEERAAVRADAPSVGTLIGGVEVIPLESAAGAIFTTPGTLKSLADAGKVQLTLINGTPFISYAELEKAEEAMAPMMDAASDYEMTPERADGLFTSIEAGAYLGCSAGTVNRKTNEGLIRRAAKDGRAWLYDRAALDDWRERRKVIATMRRRTGPLGLPNAGRAETPEYLVHDARAEVKKLAERMQALLGTASYASVTVGSDAITAKRVQIEEEEI